MLARRVLWFFWEGALSQGDVVWVDQLSREGVPVVLGGEGAAWGSLEGGVGGREKSQRVVQTPKWADESEHGEGAGPGPLEASAHLTEGETEASALSRAPRGGKEQGRGLSVRALGKRAAPTRATAPPGRVRLWVTVVGFLPCYSLLGLSLPWGGWWARGSRDRKGLGRWSHCDPAPAGSTQGALAPAWPTAL